MVRKINKTNNFLNSNGFWIVFSILVALLLWVYVTNVEGEKTSVTFQGIDVTLEGEEALRESKGYIITDLSANTISVELYGPINVLADLRSTDLSAIIDVSATSRTGSVEKTYDIAFPPEIDSSNITITERQPSTLTFFVDNEASKTFELRGVFTGSVAEGYIRDEFIFDPLNVLVSGPATEIEKISHAEVVVEREEIDRTVTFDSTFELVDFDGNIVESDDLMVGLETVNVSLTVKATKEVPFVIDLVDGGGATIQHANVTYEPKTITISGDPSILEGVNNINLGTIDLATVDPVLTEEYVIIIPNETENVTGTTEVTVNVEVLGLEKEKLDVSNINFTVTNLSEEFDYEMVNESIEIEVRGPAESLSDVNSNNIRLVVDLSEVSETGTVIAPATVHVDGFTNVAAIGDYDIYLRIIDAE